MRALPLVVLALSLAACEGDALPPDDPDGGGGGDGSNGPDASGPDAQTNFGEPPGLEGTVAAHNEARAMVGVGPMTWDPRLADIARAWVVQCVDTMQPIGLVDHNPNRSNGYPTYVGENIYGSGGGATGVDAVRLWVAERANYDYEANTCSGICGHYTQVVWRNTTMVGCALHTCPGLTYGATVVCNYGPGGNVGGQRPY